MVYGDEYRPAQRFVEALEAAGFTEVQLVPLGERVYPYTWTHAKSRFRQLRRDRSFPLSMKLLAYANLEGLERLYAWRQIDYVLITAKVPPGASAEEHQEPAAP